MRQDHAKPEPTADPLSVVALGDESWDYSKAYKEEPESVVPPTKKPTEATPDPEPTQDTDDPATLLQKAMEAISEQSVGKVDQEALEEMRNSIGTLEKLVLTTIELVEDKIQEVEAPTSVEVKRPGAKDYEPVAGEITHKDFPEILSAVQSGVPVMLKGPAGSGKTRLYMQLADAMGFEFSMASAVYHKYELSGLVDGHGIVRDSSLANAFKGSEEGKTGESVLVG